MEKSRWLEFLSARLRSQISLENAQKAERWAFALFGLASLGAALAAVGSMRVGGPFLYATKILFLLLFYLILLLGVHLPSTLQRGEKPLGRLLGIRDFSSLLFIALAVAFYSLILLRVSHQAAVGVSEMTSSTFLAFVAWANDVTVFLHTATCFLFLVSLFVFPKTVVKVIERSTKIRRSLLGFHITLALLLGIGYAQMTEIGSPDFFEQLRVAGLFWIFIATSLIFIGRLLGEASVPALAALEIDLASGRLERDEDITARFKEAFVSRRLIGWLGRMAHDIAGKTEKIAHFCHEAVTLVSREKPSEIDLNQVEDRYRRAEALHRQLEKDHGRFLLSISLFDLSETARARVEELKEQFSRELRNAKLEVASVRKRIDERLTSLKNQQPLQPAPLSSAQPVSQ